MLLQRLRISIRMQLLLIFGLLLFTGAAVLLLDEISEYRTREALDTLNRDSLAGMRRMKAISDAYGMEIVDTAFRVRNDLMGWEQGVSVIDNALARIRQHWLELTRMPRLPEQQALFVQIAQARTDADRAAEKLRAILQRQDIAALGRFADTEMYPAIDPVTTRLKFLSDLEMIDAERVVREDAARVEGVRLLRIGISLATLLVVGLMGQTILRNIYRGVESLTDLAQRMRERDYETLPRFTPRGELGLVQEAFLAMRSDILVHEAELTESLARTEDMRRTLEQRELFQRSLLDAAPTAIIAMDAQGVFTHVNPFAQQLLGYSHDELLGRRARLKGEPEPDDAPRATAPGLLDDAELALAAKALGSSLGREIPPNWRVLQTLAELDHGPREWTLIRRDGVRVPVLMAVSAMKDEAGSLVGLLAVATDLTAIKQLEGELRESEQRAKDANRAKSAFLAAMSHEIRTPLIGVTGMVEVLGHTRLDEEQRRALNIIQHSARALLQIIGDILDFSKIEAGKLDLEPVPVNLRKLVATTACNFLSSASGKGLTLAFSVDDAIAQAHVADPVRIRQVLSNFLSNAIKFTERGSVTLRCQRLGGEAGAERIEFSVADTGIGVSEEAQQRLFQPFTQAESSTTRRYGGTGLGLTICRRLAELMGGEVAMRSRVGEGTTMSFVVQLPVASPDEVDDSDALDPLEASEAFVPRRLPTVQEAEQERSLILLVDDHPTNRVVIARQLALAGFACETAEDGEQGLARWRSGRYALVLSDIHMPGMDGYQMTAAIRALEQREGRPRTPILALTAAALKGDAERTLAAGMDDYLIKPVTIPVLVERLHHWLPHLAPAAPADAAAAEAMADGAAAAAAPARPAPPLARPGEPAPIDLSVLVAIAGEDLRAQRELLDDYLDATRHDVDTLRRALETGDASGISREAHRIKGAARLVGTHELAEAAEAVEQAAREARLETVQELGPGLFTAFERLQLFVDQRYGT